MRGIFFSLLVAAGIKRRCGCTDIACAARHGAGRCSGSTENRTARLCAECRKSNAVWVDRLCQLTARDRS
jgi:hypothetical protein